MNSFSRTQIDLIQSSLPKNSRVLVAMSGGVDSSLSATLIKRAGFEVIGVTLKLHERACFENDINDAKKIASSEGFEHHTINYQKYFKENIIDYFVEGYKSGSTPSPCSRCNKLIKFAKLNELAEQFQADIIVTGHYVKKVGDDIYKSKHEFKDQSYFLALTNKDHLKKAFFPLANLEKPQVREIANDFGLFNAKKSESQDVCFIPKTYQEFLETVAPEIIQYGEICDKEGNVLGKHSGITQYTIGQRKNLGLSGGPWFVIKIDTPNNRIFVGKMEDLLKSEITLEETNLIVPKEVFENQVFIKIRARHTPAPGKFDLASKKAYFHEPQMAITPGQVAAFYDANGRLLGGGIISN